MIVSPPETPTRRASAAPEAELPDAPLAFFQAATAAFEAACDTGPLARREVRIGSRVVQLRMAGRTVPPQLLPALAHLPAPQPHAREPEVLQVDVWDAEATTVPLPAPPWAPSDYGPRGLVRGYNTERVRTAYQIGSGVLSVLDRHRQRAIVAIRDAAALPYYERGSPLLSVFHWGLQSPRAHLVHAAAVGYADGGVLLVGPGGSGKSTTALACIGSDLLYAGDDYCLCTLAPEAQPRVISLYNTAKLKAGGDRWLPHLSALIENPDRGADEKALLFLHRHQPLALSLGFPLRAVVIPRVIGGAASSLHRAKAAEAFRALVPSTVLQLPGTGGTEMLARLVRGVPAFRLDLGTNVAQIPHLLGGLLRDLRAGGDGLAPEA